MSGAAEYWHTEVNGVEVIAAGREDLARQLARDLILFERAFFILTGLKPRETRLPTTIFSLTNRDFEAGFRRPPTVAGFFASTGFSNDMILGPELRSGSARRDRLYVIYHEYVHYLMRTHSALRYPPWYVEGFAELFASAAVGEHAVTVGHVDPDRAATLIEMPLLPAQTVLRLERSDPRFYSHSVGPAFYAQSWLLVHLASIEGKFRGETLEYLRQLHGGMPEPEAFAASFGGDYTVLDRAMRDAIRGSPPLEAVRVKVPPLVEPVPPPRRLEPAEFDLRYAEAILRQRGEAKLAEERLRRALRARAGDERALRLLARALLRLDRAPEMHSIVSELEARPALEARTWAELGELSMEALMREGTKPTRLNGEWKAYVHAARARYRRAIELEPHEPEPLVNLAKTYVLLPDGGTESRALMPLLLAQFEKHPSSEPLASSIAQLHRIHGSREEAARYAMAWTRLAASRESLAEANRLLLGLDGAAVPDGP